MGLSESAEQRPTLSAIISRLQDDLVRRELERATESVSIAGSISRIWNDYSTPITGAAVVGTAAFTIWRLQSMRK